ncbi:MAG: SMC-Scp complex subunit ScpB [Geminicoccaceae bacterium]|nr:SMC-Scp complex subunit ScpB [Geminicoccaceae bacterium]
MSDPPPKAIVEAMLFAAAEPLSEAEIQARLGGLGEALPLLEELRRDYRDRGVRLERQGRRWALRTAPETAPFLVRADPGPRRLSKAAMETLAVIAWRQPATRAEIEAVRGVPVARGTLDVLLGAGWVRPKGRREAPGRPVTWVTTPGFLDAFGLSSLDDLPRLDELGTSGLFRFDGAD